MEQLVYSCERSFRDVVLKIIIILHPARYSCIVVATYHYPGSHVSSVFFSEFFHEGQIMTVAGVVSQTFMERLVHFIGDCT